MSLKCSSFWLVTFFLIGGVIGIAMGYSYNLETSGVFKWFSIVAFTILFGMWSAPYGFSLHSAGFVLGEILGVAVTRLSLFYANPESGLQVVVTVAFIATAAIFFTQRIRLVLSKLLRWYLRSSQ